MKVNATPKGTRMMWKPRVNAICSRAGSSWDGSAALVRIQRCPLMEPMPRLCPPTSRGRMAGRRRPDRSPLRCAPPCPSDVAEQVLERGRALERVGRERGTSAEDLVGELAGGAVDPGRE